MLNVFFLCLSLWFGLVWFASCWAENNRTPSDFAAGQSELVPGFNIEYGGGRGYTDFWAEYANILLLRLFFCIIFYYCVFSKQNGHVKPQDQPSKDYSDMPHSNVHKLERMKAYSEHIKSR